MKLENQDLSSTNCRLRRELNEARRMLNQRTAALGAVGQAVKGLCQHQNATYSAREVRQKLLGALKQVEGSADSGAEANAIQKPQEPVPN